MKSVLMFSILAMSVSVLANSSSNLQEIYRLLEEKQVQSDLKKGQQSQVITVEDLRKKLGSVLDTSQLNIGDIDSGGGDLVAQDFFATAYAVEKNLNSITPQLSQKEKANIANVIKKMKVLSVDQLSRSGIPVTAINIPKYHLVLVNRTRWEARGRTKMIDENFVLHELLGLAGIDDTKYRFSTSYQKKTGQPRGQYYRVLDRVLDLNGKETRFATAFGLKNQRVDFNFLDSIDGRWHYFDMEGQHCLYVIDTQTRDIVSDYFCSYSYSFFNDIGNTVAEFNGVRFGEPDHYSASVIPVSNKSAAHHIEAVLEKFTTRSGSLQSLTIYKEWDDKREKAYFCDYHCFDRLVLQSVKQAIPFPSFDLINRGRTPNCHINLIAQNKQFPERLDLNVQCEIDDIYFYEVSGAIEFSLKGRYWLDAEVFNIKSLL